MTPGTVAVIPDFVRGRVSAASSVVPTADMIASRSTPVNAGALALAGATHWALLRRLGFFRSITHSIHS
jgi:hypothetical protein